MIRSLVPPESQVPPPLYLTRLDEAYWFTELPEAKAVYFQFHHVANAPREDFESFSKRLKNFLDEKHPDNLIKDVRHNNGGNAQLLPPLLRALVQFEGSKPNAQIYVISGRTTYSGCQIFIAHGAHTAPLTPPIPRLLPVRLHQIVMGPLAHPLNVRSDVQKCGLSANLSEELTF